MTGARLIGISALIVLVVLCALVYAVLPNALPPQDTGNQCPPAYPGGAGTWLLDGGDCWYLHTEAEFDTNPPDNCIACHNGTDAAEW